MQPGDVAINMKTPRTFVDSVIRSTAPAMTWHFFAFFTLAAYLHETYPKYTLIVLAVWTVVHLIYNAPHKDYFWFFMGALGNLMLYLFFGFLWSMAKLYFDVWQERLDPELLIQLTEVEPLVFVDSIKWLIVKWMVTWPISAAYTLSRQPLYIFTDLIFQWSRRRYVAIISAALSADESNISGWNIVLFMGTYITTGYLWTHIKLFIDVWQSRLPMELETRLISIYEKKKSYWQFVVEAKWLITRWIITWPFSLIHTMFRDPLRILVDWLYNLSQRQYVIITEKAMDWRAKKVQ